MARDKSYEARQRQMKSRLTSMLEGESQSSGIEEEMVRSIEKKAEENNRECEEELLRALRSCCTRSAGTTRSCRLSGRRVRTARGWRGRTSPIQAPLPVPQQRPEVKRGGSGLGAWSSQMWRGRRNGRKGGGA